MTIMKDARYNLIAQETSFFSSFIKGIFFSVGGSVDATAFFKNNSENEKKSDKTIHFDKQCILQTKKQTKFL